MLFDAVVTNSVPFATSGEPQIWPSTGADHSCPNVPLVTTCWLSRGWLGYQPVRSVSLDCVTTAPKACAAPRAAKATARTTISCFRAIKGTGSPWDGVGYDLTCAKAVLRQDIRPSPSAAARASANRSGHVQV